MARLRKQRWHVNVSDFTAMHMSLENLRGKFKQEYAQITIKCQIKQLRKMTLLIAWATSITFFTITADILARSLPNFYCQYADRYVNSYFIRCVNKWEQTIWQFVILKKNLIDVNHASDLLFVINCQSSLRIHKVIAS